MFSCEGVCLVKLFGGLVADTICLPREGPDSYISVEGLAFCYKFEDMSFLKLLHVPLNKINANNFDKNNEAILIITPQKHL